MSMGRTEGLDAVATVQSFTRGELSAEALVEASLRRASSRASLNAVIELAAPKALAAAHALDLRRRRGERLPPLAGLPLLVKDNIDWVELPTTGATPALRDFIPSATAPALTRLIEAGAIVIGKANLHELASGVTCAHQGDWPLPVRNPHAPERIAGGSSGGNAAAIAAGIVTCGLGTDTGGSLRIPAALCGIVGFRPSRFPQGHQRYPQGGVLPISPRHDTVGPMGRSVRDIQMLDAVMAGGRRRVEEVRPAKLRLGVASWFWSPLDPRLRDVLEQALQRFAEVGVTLVEIEIDELETLNARVSPVINLHEPSFAIPAYLAKHRAPLTLEEIIAGVVDDDVRRAFERTLAGETAPLYQQACEHHAPALSARFDRLFTAHRLDALCLPTTLLPALPITSVAKARIPIAGRLHSCFDAYIRNTTPLSSAGLASISLPAGATRDGLPVGLELAGSRGDDDHLLAIAATLEALLDPPPLANLDHPG